MNTMARTGKGEFYANNMGRPALYSAIFHVIIFALATIGFPYFITKTEPTEMAITVELIDLAENSQTNILEKPQKSEADKPPKERKPVYNNTDIVPDLLSPQEPEINDEVEQPKEKPELDLTQIKKPPKPKSKPRKPKPPKQIDKNSEKPARLFDSILKDVLDEEPDTSLKALDLEDGKTSQVASVSEHMLRSMEADLNSGIEHCWNVDAGGKNAETQIVKLYVYVNRDRTVRDVKIIEQFKYNTDMHYRAAAEAARRAIMNRQCWPLRLPEDKYEVWKSFPYTFDPSEML